MSELEDVEYQFSIEGFESRLEKGHLQYGVDPEKKIARIVFNRPEKLNAMTNAALAALPDLVARAERDDSVKVIVFEGRGDHFGTGADANELGRYLGFEEGKPRPSQRRRAIADRQVVFGGRGFEQAVARSLKVTVCKVQGYCYGGHLQIAMASDIVVCADNALFGHPAWRYLGPIFNYWMLIEAIGMKRAKEMLFTCRPIAAAEAVSIGLANRVVDLSELDASVEALCADIALLPADGIAMAKALLEQTADIRGAGASSTLSWIGHAWQTNLRFDDGEWNFLKERRDKGLHDALEERDRMVQDPKNRMGEARERE